MKYRAFLFVLAGCILLGFGAFAFLGDVTYPWGKILESRKSLYNNIYLYKSDKYLNMAFGFNRKYYVESRYNPLDELELPIPYTRFMTVGAVYAKNMSSILEIGSGGGRTSWYLHRFFPNASVTSVELDPVVVELARKYFGIKGEPGFHIVSQDGRLFLSHTKDKYDIILIDAYRGPFVPFHLLTKEFYQLVKNHLADGGVVVQNVAPSTMLFDLAVKTINSVFPQLDFYKADGNIITIAYDGNAHTPNELEQTAQKRQTQSHLRYDLPDMLKDRRHFVPDDGFVDANAKTLTDDFAPVEALQAIERYNRKWTSP